MGVYLPIKDYSAMQGPCPDGFHVPLSSERQTVNSMGISLGAWTSSGYTDISNYLKLPLAGARGYSDGSVAAQGKTGYYWCSDVDGRKAYHFFFNSYGIFDNGSTYKCISHSIRAFKDTPVTPDSSWTVLYQGTGTAGIYHNSTLGLISISSDGQTWETIADKNIGAPLLNYYGYTYQRGNNYGFGWGSINTSSTKVDASNYGPGNYYNTGLFITTSSSPYDRSSVQNDNLWGGVTGVKPISELKNAYIGEYAGIYHNATLGLISLSSDGSNWITIADKNLGATTVWNNGDTLSEANCGKYYQWGNNYGFPFTGSVTTSSTQVNASNYGPGNYYNSSTFITGLNDWSSVQNDNLWGGEDGNVPVD